jgi:hypothetical protein
MNLAEVQVAMDVSWSFSVRESIHSQNKNDLGLQQY